MYTMLIIIVFIICTYVVNFFHIGMIIDKAHDDAIRRSYEAYTECQQMRDALIVEMQGQIDQLKEDLQALQDDFKDLSRDFKALTTLGSTQPYTPLDSQIFYGLDGTQVDNKEE